MIVLGCLLVLLKATRILDISWVLVLAPFWVPYAWTAFVVHRAAWRVSRPRPRARRRTRSRSRRTPLF